MRVAVLGSTGSIGLNTLDVLERHRDRYEVFALAAHSNVARLREQCLLHRPRFAVVVDSSAAALLASQLRSAGLPTEVLAGEDALSEIAAHDDVDTVMAAIVGAAGLGSSLAAARAGKRILLANKEALVMSGPLFMQAVRDGGATLIPVDSEHNAIFQCMGGSGAAGVRRVLLTASGGPFLRTAAADLRNVTPEQACAHPRWVMGRKISVDSATLMNKGLELIEACLLFGLPARQVEVVVHPQSIVHSLVEYVDGSMLAQLGNPDMRTPIAHALGWPERIELGCRIARHSARRPPRFRSARPGAFPRPGAGAQRRGGRRHGAGGAQRGERNRRRRVSRRALPVPRDRRADRARAGALPGNAGGLRSRHSGCRRLGTPRGADCNRRPCRSPCMISTDSPLQFVINLAAFIVAIGVLVAVHEFGHFWVARRLGIRVLRFSIGFGKPLYRRVLGKDPVEFVVAAIPLGGYVKLLDEREGNVAERDLPFAFNRQPVWKRIATLLAGPAFNLIFAIALYWVLFAAGVPALRPIVGEITPDSIAARAGLRYEDQIVAIGGEPTPTLEAATLAILEDLTDNGTIDMRVQGVGGAERELSLVAGDRSRELTRPEALLPGLGFDIWRPRVKATVGEVVKGKAGDRAGLKVGDEILAIDGQPVSHFQELVNQVKPNPGRTVSLQVRRDGRRPRRPGQDRRGHGGRRENRPHRHRPEGPAYPDRAYRGRHAHAAEVRRGGGGRPGRGQDLGHLDLHFAHRRPNHHRRRVVAGDLGADQYRGNNRFRSAARLAHVPRHPGADQHQPRRPEPAADPDSRRWASGLSACGTGEGPAGLRACTAARPADRHRDADPDDDAGVL